MVIALEHEVPPSKETDLEAADNLGGEARLVDSDAEEAEEGTALRGSQRKAEKKFRLRADVEMGHAAYCGKQSSRAQVFNISDDEGEDVEDDNDGDDDGGMFDDELMPSGSGESEDDEDDGDDDLDEAHDDSMDADMDGKVVMGDSASDEEDDAPEEDGAADNDEEGAATAAADGDDAEMQVLEAEYAATADADVAAITGLAGRAAADAAKGRAVAKQQVLWEKGLGLRIATQKVVVDANKLPPLAVRQTVAAVSNDVAAAYRELADEAVVALDECCELADALMGQNDAVATAAEEASVTVPAVAELGKRKRGQTGLADAAWAALEERACYFQPYCEASLDRWHRKTQLVGGALVGRGGAPLRALNQSISAQVASKMAEPDRLIERTQLRMDALPKRPCVAEAGPLNEDEDDSKDEGGADEDARDAETFNDADFYQTLLKEFLENTMTDAASIGILRSNKKKKVVDRRASKGRKLRYHMLDKLVNFMAPVPIAQPTFASQLFGNLFGGAR